MKYLQHQVSPCSLKFKSELDGLFVPIHQRDHEFTDEPPKAPNIYTNVTKTDGCGRNTGIFHTVPRVGLCRSNILLNYQPSKFSIEASQALVKHMMMDLFYGVHYLGNEKRGTISDPEGDSEPQSLENVFSVFANQFVPLSLLVSDKA